MTQLTTQGPAVKPGPNVYTVLLIIAILCLVTAIVVVLNNLAAYGVSVGDVFSKFELPKDFVQK